MSAEYRTTRTVSISDCDERGRIRPSALLVLMQEVGEIHASSYGLSRARLVERGMCWVLYRQRVVMRTLPPFGEEIGVTTWPGAVEGPLFPRCFTFDSADGTHLGDAVTAWVLMDINTRRPLRPTVIDGEVPACGRPAPLPMPGMLRVTGGEPLGTRAVRYSDVDVNGHMNNTRYIDWVCDTMDYKALAARGLAEWQINYTAEALPGETLDLCAQPEGDATLFAGKRLSDGRAVFEARAVLGAE